MGKLSKHTRKRLIKLLTAMGMFGLMAVWDWAIPQNTAWKLVVSMLLGGTGLFISIRLLSNSDVQGKQQVLERMWRNRNTFTLLVGLSQIPL